MGKIIEMNYKGEDGSYVVLWPRVYSNVVLNSQDLLSEFQLDDGSNIDDVLLWIKRKQDLIQYNKAGVNVTVQTAGGTPWSGLTITGINANIDGTGACITDEQGKCFGYCNAGSVTIAVSGNSYADISYNNQQIQAEVAQMYNVQLTATLYNFRQYTSSTTVRFSDNVERVDVSVGAGGGGGGGNMGTKSGRGGGGGWSIIQENASFSSDISYSLQIGSGGQVFVDGGNSSFLQTEATGGKSGESSGNGSGNGGNPGGTSNRDPGGPGGSGTTYIYTSFEEQTLYGGGGGGGAYCNSTALVDVSGGIGGDPGGGKGAGVSRRGSQHTISATPGVSGLAGGGGGQSIYRNASEVLARGFPAAGGSGRVAIRMHLKVTS